MFQQIREWDVKIGKKIFHPIVIKLCHILKCNQYRLSRDIWFMTFAGLAIHEVFIKHEPLVWWKWMVLTIFFLSAVVFKDTKSSADPITRGLLWVNLLSFIVAFVVVGYTIGQFVSGLVTGVILLIAEYAKTIDTIPPKKDKQKKSKEVYHESLVG